MNIAVITGASSGIGREFAMQVDAMFHKMDEIWLIARRKERLEELAASMKNRTRIFSFDVTDENEMKTFAQTLEEKKPVIRMLVNCAGFGMMGEFEKLTMEIQLGMLDVNCRALTQMTYQCIPYMRKNSRIIQLASSAAFLPQPSFAVYAATKAYVLSLSRALDEEMREKKIYVTAVCPGPVDTEFFDIAEQYGKTLAIKKMTLVKADRVVREALAASKEKRPVSVCSFYIKCFYALTKLLPHTLLLKITCLLKQYQ